MENNQAGKPVTDVIVIGAGHAGLSISYWLKQHGIEHIVFERGNIGETWKSQRWDSFVMNTANKKNILPGQTYSGDKPDGFGTAGEFVTALKEYASHNQLPVIENAEVISVIRDTDDINFTVTVSEKGITKTYQTKQIVVASGCQNEKRIPAFAENIHSNIQQLHTGTYRNASQLPKGAVLVVGSAQSGCQIAEELAQSARKVYLSTSMVPRIPRRYRGKDIVDWLTAMGFFNVTTESVTDPKVLGMKVPLLSGVGEYGHTLSYQLLAQNGVILLGKLENADGQHLTFASNSVDHVKFADGFSQKAKGMVDEFILKNRVQAPANEEDPGDIPDAGATCASNITSLNLSENQISTIIWTTGFTGDFSFLKFLQKWNNDGTPQHKNGLSEIDSLYFIGLQWLRMRKSSMIFGINDDAVFIADIIAEKIRENSASQEQ